MQAGSRIGQYEILAPLGKGGMGEVWKARDVKLPRQVAIKALPDELAQDPVRLAQMEREAGLLATLNHPNLATIHGLEEQDGSCYIVLELVEGQTLDQRLRLQPLLPDEALTLALQIARGLEAAHARGIVHRDLKPGNVMITPEGHVKLLDFGIAKSVVVEPDDGPTMPLAPTREGAVVGTPAYMSPEQALGEPAGLQTDVWSFGALLYEMLTGRSPFRQDSTAETLANVLGSQPDYSALPGDTPLIARWLMRRCLVRNTRHRLQHMGDVRLAVEDALPSLASPEPEKGPEVRLEGASFRSGAAWVAAGTLSALGVGILVGWQVARLRERRAAVGIVRASVPFPEPPVVQPFGTRDLAISEDGSTIAYASRRRLWVRRIGDEDPVAITTTLAWNPFFSPDGTWVGWFDVDALVRAPVRGGAPQTITATTDRPAGGTWREDGTIVYATSEGLFRVSADGGTPTLLIAPDRTLDEALYAWPQFLPDGRSVLFTVVGGGTEGAQRVEVLDVETLARKRLLNEASCARFVTEGHLVYARGATLNAIAFDPSAGRTEGDPFRLADVGIETASDNGAASFAVSGSGTLVYASEQGGPSLRTLQWVDRNGRREPLAVEPQGYIYPSISPDGRRVALDRISNGNRDIWILDLERMTQTQLSDSPAEDMLPTWSPDGQRVFFASNRTGTFDVYSQAADGASPARVEFAGPEFQVPSSVTPDGSSLLVYERYQDTSLLDLSQPGRLQPLLSSEFDERLATVSPDGHWLAYESDESGGQIEIMLRSFPNVTERREKVSVSGGRYPRWGRPGTDELYYVTPEGAMMAASVRLSPTLALGEVTKLFDGPEPAERLSGLVYDVSPLDGRFLVVERPPIGSEGPATVHLVLGLSAWLQEGDGDR